MWTCVNKKERLLYSAARCQKDHKGYRHNRHIETKKNKTTKNYKNKGKGCPVDKASRWLKIIKIFDEVIKLRGHLN